MMVPSIFSFSEKKYMLFMNNNNVVVLGLVKKKKVPRLPGMPWLIVFVIKCPLRATRYYLPRTMSSNFAFVVLSMVSGCSIKSIVIIAVVATKNVVPTSILMVHV